MLPQRAVAEAEQHSHLSKVPAQVERHIERFIIRHSTFYTTPEEISFFARLIELCASELRELSIEFCGCFRGDQFIDNSIVFAPSSKLYGLMRYVGYPVESHLIGSTYAADFKRKLRPGPEECEMFRPIIDSIVATSAEMRKVRVLTLINPPQELLELQLPINVELVVLSGSAIPGELLQELGRLKRLRAVSLSYCDFAASEKELLGFLRESALLHAESFEQNLQKYFGACARHTSLGEISAHYTETQLLAIRNRLGCSGVQLLDLQSCNIDLRLGFELAEALISAENLQVLALRGNNIDLTLRRRNQECNVDIPEETDTLAQFLQTSMSDGFRKNPTAAVLASFRQYNMKEAEQYELLEMKKHFIVRLLDGNEFIRKVWLDEGVSPCLREYTELKCRLNETRLHDAVISTCTEADFINRDKNKLIGCVEGESSLNNCLISLLDIADPMRQKKTRRSISTAKRSQKKGSKLPGIREEKLQIPKRTAGRIENRTEQAVIRNIKEIREESSRISSHRDTSHMSAHSEKTETSTRSSKATHHYSKLTSSRLTSSPVESPSVSFQKSEKSSRASSKSRAGASSFRVESTYVSDDAQSRIKSSITNESVQRPKISVLKDKEDMLKLQELLRPFRAEPQEEVREPTVVTQEDEELLQKIVDMLYDALVFSCNEDELRAKQVFLGNQEKILEYCNYLVNDIHAGRLAMREVRSQLFSFIESYI